MRSIVAHAEGGAVSLSAEGRRLSFRDGRWRTFRSTLERDWMVALDFDPRCVELLEQPFTLMYEHEGRTHKYTPDLRAVFRDRTHEWVEVYEVKPAKQLLDDWARWKPRFRAARRYCRERGWTFELITDRDMRTPYVENAKFLRQYRDLQGGGSQRLALTSTLEKLGVTTPQMLVTATWASSEKRLEAVRELWRLVALGVIHSWLDRPLTMSSEIWLAAEG